MSSNLKEQKLYPEEKCYWIMPSLEKKSSDTKQNNIIMISKLF